MATVMLVASIALLLVTAGVFVFEVFWYTRSKRSESALKLQEEPPPELGLPRPPAMAVPAPTAPTAVTHPAAGDGFGTIWFVVGVFVTGTFLLIATQVLGAVRPDLMRNHLGQILATGVWGELAMFLAIICLMVTVTAVRSAKALRRDVPRLSALNVALPQGWSVACVGSLALFALLAVAASVWRPAFTYYASVDGAGNHYAVLGDSLVRWDAEGRRTLTVDITEKPFEVSDVQHLCVAPDGGVVLADAGERKLVKVAASGAFVATVAVPVDRFAGRGRRARTPISVDIVGQDTYVLSGGEVWGIASDGQARSVYADEDARWAEDLAVRPDGGLVLADPGNGRLVQVGQDAARSIECLGWEGDYRYPDVAKVGDDGTIYAVVRKPWQRIMDMHFPGAPYILGEEPETWMGEIYAFSDDGPPRHIPVSSGGVPMGVFDLSPMPDGRLSVMALNVEGVFIGDSKGGEFSRLDAGDLGEVLSRADREVRIKSVAPQVFGGLAVAIPLVLGVMGAAQVVRRKGQVLPAAAAPAVPIAMGERVIESAGHGAKGSRWMVFLPAVAAVPMGVMVFSMMRTMPASLRGTSALMLVPAAMMIGLSVWMFFSKGKPTRYVFDDSGVSVQGGPIAMDWASVVSLSVRRVKSASASVRPLLALMGAQTPSGQRSFTFLPEDLGVAAFKQVLRELRSRVSPGLIDPSVLVWSDLADGASAALASGTLGPTAVTALETCSIGDMTKVLEADLERAWSADTALLLGQALYLSGRSGDAARVCGRLAASPGASAPQLLCAGLATFDMGDAPGAAGLLDRIPPHQRMPSVEAFRLRMLEPGARLDPGPAPKANWVISALVVVVILGTLLEVWAMVARSIGD